MEQIVRPTAPFNAVTIEEATAVLKSARRILVIGCSGGGKSTLSHALSDRFGLRHISMDREVFWLPGWVQRPKSEQRAIIGRLVAEEGWIMDGTNTSSFDIRLPRTELVIWVRMRRLACMWGITSRWLKWRGRPRPEMAPGCPEKLDWEFLHYVWTFESRVPALILNRIAEYAPDVPVAEIKTRSSMRALLDLLGAPA
ncbi:AAA family ATPase [Rhizobium sp. BK251]|uniref:AAA family ATPase n=1 Tax=Rhizobium sp. BK251 TaxID=2512125 RepID=UPI0010536A42|nr:AAA family ATPase [Rhizobium sp. BK251]TCL73705.1 adenylate kinase family enzyme [Rhizobium sp. BK251]